MNKLKKNNIVNFPGKISEAEREIEAIIFAAAEPLSIETIELKISKKIDVLKALEKLKNFYSNRGINLVCISNKWSFRTAQNLSSLMSQQKTVEKKLSKAAIETLASIVSISSGSEAAKIIASTSRSPDFSSVGKLTILFLFSLVICFFYT